MDAEFKKALRGAKWADTGDRIDMDSTDSGAVAIDRATGYPDSMSRAANGHTPDRRKENQINREQYGAVHDLIMGIFVYDADVDYPQHAICQTAAGLWRATRPNGPGISGGAVAPGAPNQTAWEIMTGTVGLPSAPRDITFDNSTPREMAIRWKNGQDGGARIETYDFQSRLSGDSPAWSPGLPISVAFAQHRLTGLKAGRQVQVRVRTRTLGGISEWAVSVVSANTDAASIVRGAVPSGGAAVGLQAQAGNAQVNLTWAAPDDGGFPIKQYRVQWRPAAGAFSASDQHTTTTRQDLSPA